MFAYPFAYQIILTAIVWITYCYIVRYGGHVSDDLSGICDYDGILQTKSSESVKSDEKLSSEDKKKRLEELNKRHLLKRLLDSEYGMISRWVRFHICGGNFPSKHRFHDQQGPDGKIVGGDFIPCGKVSTRHHTLSVIVFNLAVLSTYFILSKLIGEELAFLACALFVVHPVVTQGVAWSSGLGYPLSLFWITLSLNLSLWYYTLSEPSLLITILILILFALIQVLAINALFVALASWVILLFLGHYPFALVAFLISIAEGLKIVRDTINLRKDEFKKQSMGASTYLKPRKIIVATKTFLYYLKHTLWPDKMGLYHKWGYNYEVEVEREDRYFVLGLIAVAALTAWFLLTPHFVIKLGVIWFVSFIFIFLNWITIQQFVTERYLMIPTIGTCIIVSFLLKDHLELYLLIFGMALVRTWLHLPTYDDEMRFYLSNTWNFRDSEVALGNLGVTHIRIGEVGSSLDRWHESIRVNPEYDVPYYNIYSHHKSNAMFHIQRGNFPVGLDLLRQSLPYLEKCVNCKICHFKNDWKKELDDLKSWIENPMKIILNEENRLIELRQKLSMELSNTKDEKRRNEIIPSINDANNALNIIQKTKNANLPLVYQARQLTEDSLLKSLTKGV